MGARDGDRVEVCMKSLDVRMAVGMREGGRVEVHMNEFRGEGGGRGEVWR